MNKIFTYPRFHILVLIASLLGIFAFAMVAKGFLVDAIRSEELLNKLVAGVVGLFCLLGAVWIIIGNVMNFVGARKIIARDEELILQNPLRTKKIHWKDITEFGTYIVIFGYSRNRYFYVKVRKQAGKKIVLCNQYLENLHGLVDVMFLKAINAKFVIVENVAWVPFTRKIERIPWDVHNRSFL